MDRYTFLLRERLAQAQEWLNRRHPRRFELVLLACLVVGLTALLSSQYLPSLRGFKEGAPAPEKVVANKTVAVVDLAATEELKRHVAELVAPVYVYDPNVIGEITEALEGLFSELDRWRGAVTNGGDTTAALAALRAVAPPAVSNDLLNYLLTADESTVAEVRNQTLGALKTVYTGAIAENALEATKAKLRSIADSLAGSSQTADAVYELASSYLRPNQVLDEAQTQARREKAMNEVAPVMLSVVEDQVVLQEGETVTAQHMLVLKALGLIAARSGWRVWVGIFLLVLLQTALFSRLVRRFNRAQPEFDNNMFLALVFLLLFATGLSRVLVIPPLSAYMIPVAALGIVVAIILNARTSLLLIVLTSLNIGLLTNLDMRYSIVGVLVGGLSLCFVSRVTRRTGLIATALVTVVPAVLSIFSVELFLEREAGEALRAGVWGIANGLLTGLVGILLLMFLEAVFNLTTPLRLLELADPAHPLLKRLMQVAPGTYNHSIQMGNLAETAAEAIGANPLLARVGAYFHDIGKSVRPEYFVENQIYVDNPHDQLTPSLSKLAITAHVRDGEQLARAYALPRPIIDIIKQHHGTSVLAYFYHKALQSSKDEPIYEESFRYQEEKPRSKEAAIVMLADSVEAAVRAMENPSRRKIQAVIEDVIRQKIEDGQLDESALTLDDLRKIRESFDASLLGLVGHRIQYPEAEGKNGRSAKRGNGQNAAEKPSDTLGENGHSDTK